MEQVSGGKIIYNLDGLNDKDVGNEFEYNGVCYFNSCLSAKDSEGRLCFMYVAKNGGSIVLIPQEVL